MPSQQGELLALTDAVMVVMGEHKAPARVSVSTRQTPRRQEWMRRDTHQSLGRQKYGRVTDNISHLHMPPSQQGELLALTDAAMVGSNQPSLRPGEQLHPQVEFEKE
jgi:hypothetical protein